MNSLTQIKNTQKATRAEIELGLSDKSSWHARYKHSAYIFTGGLPFDLTEGDLLAVFSQYGEIVDIHLVRDKKTGQSKGFAFLAYEDQRSTVLAVDNLSGARVAGRTIRVEHVDNYRKKRAEVEGEPMSDEGGRDNAKGAISSKSLFSIDIDTTVARAPAAGNGAPWSGGNSMLELLQQAKSQGLIDRPWEKKECHGDDGECARKEKKERKKKHRKRHRSRSRESGERRRRSYSRSPLPS